jgi:hypothetical protein
MQFARTEGFALSASHSASSVISLKMTVRPELARLDKIGSR